VDFNNALQPGQYRHHKRPLTVERFFKYERIETDQRKGGLDAVFYTFKVYEDMLFPYYRELRRFNPHKYVYILEDNVGAHHKACKLGRPTIHDDHILFMDAPANSPDLYIVDRLHKGQKRLLQDVRFKTSSAGAAAVNYAQAEMKRVWQSDP
jgi:hypothetical protein